MHYIIELSTPDGTPRYEKVMAPSLEQAREKAIIQAEDAAGDPYSEQTFGVMNVFMKQPDWSTVEAAALAWAVDDVFADSGQLTAAQVLEHLERGELPDELTPTADHDMDDAPELLTAIHDRRYAVLIFARELLNYEGANDDE